MIVPERIRPPGPITVGSSPGRAPRGGTPTCAPGSMTVPSPIVTFGWFARSLGVNMRHGAFGWCAVPDGRRSGDRLPDATRHAAARSPRPTQPDGPWRGALGGVVRRYVASQLIGLVIEQ